MLFEKLPADLLHKLRAVVAMLAGGYRPGPLVDWGAALHDRFTVDATPLKEAAPVPETALTPWCVDLRRLGRLTGGD